MESTFLIIICITLIIVSTLILGTASVIIIKKLAHILDLQRNTFNLTKREAQVHNRENNVFLDMLNAELHANRAKLEAYTIIYQETLTDLKNKQKEPQYRKLGDMIQMQPSLRNDVYAKNTHKLDALGSDLASRIVDFYTQLPEESQYQDVEPDADPFDVINLVQSVLENARIIGEKLDTLIQDIEKRADHSDPAENETL